MSGETREVRRAAVAAALGKHQIVREYCSRALEQQHDCIEAWRLLAWSSMEQRQHQEALRAVEEVLSRVPGDAYAHYIAAVCFHRMKKLQEALDCANASVKYAPECGVYWIRLARILLSSGASKQALAACSEATGLSPQDSFVLGEAARLYLALGKTDEGIALEEKRMRLAPDDPWVLLGYARALLLGGALEQAKEMILRAAELGPNIPAVWSVLAQILRSQGSVEDARDASEQWKRARKLQAGARVTP